MFKAVFAAFMIGVPAGIAGMVAMVNGAPAGEANAA